MADEIPTELYINESATWKVTLVDPDDGTVYNNAGGYEPIYAFNRLNATTGAVVVRNSLSGVTVTNSGDEFTLTLTPAVFASAAADDWRWELFADDGTDRWFIERGLMELRPDVIAAAVDRRTHSQIMIDRLETRLEARVNATMLESLRVDTPEGSRSVAELSMEETLRLYNYYRNKRRRELDGERVERGLEPKHRVRVRFVS